MEWFKKYGEIPIVAAMFILYILIYCYVPFNTIKTVLDTIGTFMIGWWIGGVSSWLRDKIVEIVENGGID